MTTAKFPNYFESDLEGGMYYTQGDRIYGTVTQKGVTVEYRFNDGNRPYTEEIDFETKTKAIKAVLKMAVYMRKCGSGIPTMATFRAMFS